MRTAKTILALTLGVVGCSEPEVTWHRDVKPIFDVSCLSCHREGGIAPMKLVTAQDAKAWAATIKRVVTERTMPPWLAVPGCAEYEDDQSLSDEQIATISKWVDLGAPEGSPDDAPATGEKEGGLSRVDLTLEMPARYTPNVFPDDYRCFLLDWPEHKERYITGFDVHPGNERIVHHVVAFLIPPEEVEEYERLDAEQEGEGYTCFGGPGGDLLAAQWIGAWAPGGEGADFPAGTGLRIRPGSKIAFQVHYNVPGALTGESDRSSMAVRIDDHVEKEAAVMPYTNPSWVGLFGPSTMSIPAGERDAVHSFSADPSGLLQRLTGGVFDNGESFLIHSAFLHMHTLGVSGELQLLHPAQGVSECMLDIDRWDFGWQRTYRFAEPKRFDPGDELFIECTWDNSGAKHAPRTEVKDLVWGEGTGDEMCLGLLYISRP